LKVDERRKRGNKHSSRSDHSLYSNTDMASQELDFEAIHAFTIDLARKAGKMIVEGSTKRTAGGASTGQPEIKKNRVDRELLPRYLASSRRSSGTTASEKSTGRENSPSGVEVSSSKQLNYRGGT